MCACQSLLAQRRGMCWPTGRGSKRGGIAPPCRRALQYLANSYCKVPLVGGVNPLLTYRVAARKKTRRLMGEAAGRCITVDPDSLVEVVAAAVTGALFRVLLR